MKIEPKAQPVAPQVDSTSNNNPAKPSEEVKLGCIGNCFVTCMEIQCQGDYCDGAYTDCNPCLKLLCCLTCIRPLHHLLCCPISCCAAGCDALETGKDRKVTVLSGPKQQTMS